MTCTCTHGGYHDPANYECDQAILDGTAGPAYAEAPISEHRLVTVDDEPGAYMGRCSCGALVQSGSAKDALVEHLQDVRGL